MDDIEQADEAIRLNTANGCLDCYDVVDMQIGPIGAEAKPYVPKSTPDVLFDIAVRHLGMASTSNRTQTSLT